MIAHPDPLSRLPSADLQAVKCGLERTYAAWEFAKSCQQNLWDFAVEIRELNDLGIENHSIRWLICHRLIQHAIECSGPTDVKRKFACAQNLSIETRSCFTITTQGRNLISILKTLEGSMSDSDDNGSLFWDSGRRELKLNGKTIRAFKWPAKNQERILRVFQEEGWPDRIDDPLPPTEVCPKKKLHDTIKCLNRGVKGKGIRFRGDGTGQGVIWESSTKPSNN